MSSWWRDWRRKHRTLWAKIGKSVVAIALIFSLISPTDVRLGWSAIAVIVGVVVALTLYWHAWDVVDDIREFFVSMQQDITFLREYVEGGKR